MKSALVVVVSFSVELINRVSLFPTYYFFRLILLSTSPSTEHQDQDKFAASLRAAERRENAIPQQNYLRVWKYNFAKVSDLDVASQNF